ncbi:hypothetical protein QQN94_01575 [Escherichia coli]|nr:hypothetical protein [Escherichia coli]MEA1096450.1 hypothetical protein [Escherichia coli]
MQEIRFQHPHDHFIEVADEHLVFRQVALEDRTPNGSQISAASGFKPDQMPVCPDVSSEWFTGRYPS